jgi:RecA-family ATPase
MKHVLDYQKKELTGSRSSIKQYYEGELSSVTWDSKSQGEALCPFHDDRKASLSVNAKKGLFHCHSCGAKGNIFEFHKKKHNLSFKQAIRDLQERMGIATASNIVTRYKYRDKSGKLLFEVVRQEPKRFSVRRPDGKGDWIYNIQGVKLVPFNLPDVNDSKKVFIVEGERDAETLGKYGLTASTNPFGAGKWKPEFNKYFRDKVVRIFPDNDAIGRQHALSVARNLNGIASSIKIVKLPGLEEGEDVTDWFEKEGSKKELIEIVRQTSLWSEELEQGGLMSIGELYSLRERKIEWLVEGMLPLGGFSILASPPKVGKTTLARFLAMCIAQGEPFLGREVRQGTVIYYGLEEIKVGIKEHFKSMGAKRTDNIYVFADTISSNPIEQLKMHIENVSPVFIIIDTLFRFINAEDSNSYTQMTKALSPLLYLAREKGIHICILHHTNKGPSRGQNSILGSTAISGTVDTMIMLKARGSRRMIETTQRYGESLEESELLFDKETRTLHLGNKKAETQVAECEEAILEFLSAQDETVTEAVVDEEVVGRKEFKVKALRNLVAQRKVSKIGCGGKKDPFKYSILSYSHNHINTLGTRKQESQDTRKLLSINDHTCSHNSVKRLRIREQQSDKPIVRLRIEKKVS